MGEMTLARKAGTLVAPPPERAVVGHVAINFASLTFELEEGDLSSRSAKSSLEGEPLHGTGGLRPSQEASKIPPPSVPQRAHEHLGWGGEGVGLHCLCACCHLLGPAPFVASHA